jgi:hypothetical protein
MGPMTKALAEGRIFKRGRKAAITTLEAIARALRKPATSPVWPELSFRELAERASKTLGREIPTSSVREIVYRRPTWFERTGDGQFPTWRLTREMRGYFNRESNSA